MKNLTRLVSGDHATKSYVALYDAYEYQILDDIWGLYRYFRGVVWLRLKKPVMDLDI